jgi:hypothetical protein
MALLAETQRRTLAFQVRLAQGQATAADRDWALAATRQCLQANPEDWNALNDQSAIHRHWALLQMDRGEDPTASLDAAIAATEAGLQVRPQDNALWTNLGSALRNRADQEFFRGLDPTRTLGRAIQAQQQALARPQFKDWLLDSIGCCYGTLGRYQLEHGQDPTQAIQAARDYLSQAAALKPWVGHVTAMGNALRDLATYLTLTGRDPGPTMLEARTSFEAGLQLNAHSYLAHQGLADLLLDWAEDAQNRSRPDLEVLRSAQDHLREVLNWNPGLGAGVYPRQARGHALEALACRAEPVQWRKALLAARAELDQAGALVPRQPETAIAMAAACLLLQKADPGSHDAARGLALLRPALALRPWNGMARYLKSQLQATLGQRDLADQAFQEACARNANLLGAAHLR